MLYPNITAEIAAADISAKRKIYVKRHDCESIKNIECDIVLAIVLPISQHGSSKGYPINVTKA